MLSYLVNRQYHKLTNLLPENLQVDQPERVYLPSYVDNNKEKTIENIKRTLKMAPGTRLKFKKKAIIG